MSFVHWEAVWCGKFAYKLAIDIWQKPREKIIRNLLLLCGGIYWCLSSASVSFVRREAVLCGKFTSKLTVVNWGKWQDKKTQDTYFVVILFYYLVKYTSSVWLVSASSFQCPVNLPGHANKLPCSEHLLENVGKTLNMPK